MKEGRFLPRVRRLHSLYCLDVNLLVCEMPVVVVLLLSSGPPVFSFVLAHFSREIININRCPCRIRCSAV